MLKYKSLVYKISFYKKKVYKINSAKNKYTNKHIEKTCVINGSMIDMVVAILLCGTKYCINIHT